MVVGLPSSWAKIDFRQCLTKRNKEKFFLKNLSETFQIAMFKQANKF